MLNKIQWGREGRHLECTLGVGMPFTESRATEGEREEGIKIING